MKIVMTFTDEVPNCPKDGWIMTTDWGTEGNLPDPTIPMHLDIHQIHRFIAETFARDNPEGALLAHALPVSTPTATGWHNPIEPVIEPPHLPLPERMWACPVCDWRISDAEHASSNADFVCIGCGTKMHSEFVLVPPIAKGIEP